MKTFIITAAIVILWITVIGLATRLIEDINRIYRYIRIVWTDMLERDNKKSAHWLDHQNGKWIYARCSECGTVHDTQTNFCPNCGAKMRKKVSE